MPDPTKQNPRSVIFLHLPKIAGTTLNNIIARQYSPEEIYSFGPVVQQYIIQLKSMNAAVRAKIRILIGHMGYGLHDLLVPPTTYFTVLRELGDRVISFYYFVQRNDAHYLNDYVLKDEMGLDGLVKSKISIMTDIFKVRLISVVWDQYPYGECPSDVLEQAKQNLQNEFSVVGITEEIDKIFILLKRAFGWRLAYYMRQNVTKNRPQAESFSQQTLDVGRDYNQHDLELYAFAEELFAEQIKLQGISFSVEAGLFLWLNRLVWPILNARSRMCRRA